MRNNTLDTSKWKMFKLSEFFEISTGAICDSKDLIEGETPRISVKGVNNGIQGYFCDVDSKDYRVQENFISFSFLGTCFYHPYKASLDMKVHSLKPKNISLNLFSALFLVSILKNSFKGIYADQISSSDLKQEFILLPTDSQGNIDFEFMEQTIKEIKNEVEKIVSLYQSLTIAGGGISCLTNLSCTDSHLSLQEKIFIKEAIMQIAQSLLNALKCEWKEFKLTDLFTYQRGTRLTKNNRIKGDYPLVTAGEYNKGVKEYISNENQVLFKNAITIDMFCNSFVHIDEFCCDDNVLVLNAKTDMNKG